MLDQPLFFCPQCPPCSGANNRGGPVMVAIDHCDHDYSLHCPVCKFRVACEGRPTIPLFDTDEDADAALKAGKLYDEIENSHVRRRANDILEEALALADQQWLVDG